ncbi:hypothetical protein ACHHYP_04679 [Achlya hypogyna]|uniref:PTM/DIR17-like Tudor domain-containing protein n=1 Tax=Achlya hypogyna TaxID=1202772 RepID=A0A1V9Z0G3_ACHHY|nr:hypothetical protein ACHHYP_04679 [Achlya hypogyna]
MEETHRHGQDGDRVSPDRTGEKKESEPKPLPAVPLLRPRPLDVANNSETESDSETSQRNGSFSESDSNSRTKNREAVPSDIKRTGAMLTNLLSRAEPADAVPLRRVADLPKPNLPRKDGEPLPQLHAGANNGDMRLPALTMNSFLRQSPSPGQGPPPPSAHMTNEMHMRGPPAPLQAPRMEMGMNRQGPPQTSWPPQRPQLDGEPSLKRPGSPPRERMQQYQAPQLSVQPPREDYDYPTYQPPEALVGQRIAKTFAGHGRFVGQVVKFNPQTELFTVVYADGDTEELTRENTMNLLIEDKRVHGSSKPRDQGPPPPQQQQHQAPPPMNLRKPEHMQSAPSAAPPSNSGYKLAISDRELEILTTLFEKHAWPLLAEHGWRSEIHGASFFFYPPWSGKNTREPEYFNSVLDAMKYISMHAELMRLCFPVEIQSTILSIFDQHKTASASVAPSGMKRHVDSDGPATHKRAKPDSPSNPSMPPQQQQRAPPPMMGRPGGYYEPGLHPPHPGQPHPLHAHHGYEYAPESGASLSRPGLAPPPAASRYPGRLEDDHEYHARMSGGPPPAASRGYPSPSGRQPSPRYATAPAPSSRPQMFHEGYPPREYDRSRAPPQGAPYMMPSPRQHPGMEPGPRGVPGPSRGLAPPGYTESPREVRTGAPPNSSMHQRSRVMMYPPASAPPQGAAGAPSTQGRDQVPPSMAPSMPQSMPPSMHGRYAPPPQTGNPRGPVPRGNLISMSDLDKSTPTSTRLPPPPAAGDGRMRMFAGDGPQGGSAYPPITSSNRMPTPREWDERPGGYPETYRRDERMYPAPERYAAMPAPDAGAGYYDRAPGGLQRYPPGAFAPPGGNPPGNSAPEPRGAEYQYSRRM